LALLKKQLKRIKPLVKNEDCEVSKWHPKQPSSVAFAAWRKNVELGPSSCRA